MKISMNISSLFTRYTKDEKIKCMMACRDAGFEAVDFSLCEMIEDESEFNSDSYIEIAKKYREAADEIGLTINQTHAPFKFKNWDDADNFNNVIFPRLVRCLEISGILGAETVIVHPIHYNDNHGKEATFDLNMKLYGSLIPYCEKYGVKVAVENMWRRDPRRRHIIHDTCSQKEEFVEYIDTLNSEYMIACLDVGHVGLPLQDDEAHDFVRALGHDRLKALHIHDNNYQEDDHILPYMGKMDWSELAKALGEIDYDGYFTYEINGKYLDTADDAFVPVFLKYSYEVAKHIVGIMEANRPNK